MSDFITAKVVSVWGTDRDIAHQAWASTFDLDRHEGRSDADVERVVRGVVEHSHGTPKERVWVDMAITCPLFLERQYDKARTTVQYQDFEVTFFEAPMGRKQLTQNELSGRYRTIPTRYLPCPDDVAAIVAKAVGEGAEYGPESAAADFDNQLQMQANWYDAQMGMLRGAKAEGRITNDEYKRCREVLRGVLGTAYVTQMRILGNLHAWEWILEQRLAPDAQVEARELALKIYYAMVEANVAPVFMEETMKRLRRQS
jgi:thymidylate synthase ThyX